MKFFRLTCWVYSLFFISILIDKSYAFSTSSYLKGAENLGQHLSTNEIVNNRIDSTDQTEQLESHTDNHHLDKTEDKLDKVENNNKPATPLRYKIYLN